MRDQIDELFLAYREGLELFRVPLGRPRLSPDRPSLGGGKAPSHSSVSKHILSSSTITSPCCARLSRIR